MNADKDMNLSENDRKAELLRERVEILSQNLKRTLVVAKDGDSPMRQSDLSRLSGVSRSTISLLVTGGSDTKNANPDLETLCSLADAIGISPAFLLMGGREWIAIVQAIETVLSLRSSITSESKMQSPGEMADSGVNLAKELGFYKADLDKEYLHRMNSARPEGFASEEDLIKDHELAQKIRVTNNKLRNSIRVGAASAASWAKDVDKRKYAQLLIYLGAILGAQFAKE